MNKKITTTEILLPVSVGNGMVSLQDSSGNIRRFLGFTEDFQWQFVKLPVLGWQKVVIASFV